MAQETVADTADGSAPPAFVPVSITRCALASLINTAKLHNIESDLAAMVWYRSLGRPRKPFNLNGAPRPMKMGNIRSPWRYGQMRLGVRA